MPIVLRPIYTLKYNDAKTMPYTYTLQLMLIFSLEITEFSAPLRVYAPLFFNPPIDGLALRIAPCLLSFPLP